MALICSLVGHGPDRHRAWHDGQDFRAPCRRCGVPMIRDHNVGWRPFDADRDFEDVGVLRSPRPERH